MTEMNSVVDNKLLFASMLIIALTVNAGAGNPPTNEQFVINTISDISASLIDSLGLEKTGIYIEPQSGIAGLAVDGFKTGAMNAGLTIVNSGDQLSETDYTANISLSSFNFGYEKGGSRGFLRKPNIRRKLSGQILVNINKGDFNFLGFKDFSNTGEFEPSQANYISSVRYNQLSPEPPGGGVMRFLEPLAVTATVGGLVYLFFINR